MRYLVVIALLVASVTHLTPLVGVLGVERLQALYGVPIEGADLAILMRHRAVLFGLLGGLALLAVFRPSLRPVAFSLNILSLAAFLLLAWTTGGYNALLGRLVLLDAVALAVLLAGALAFHVPPRSP